MKRVIAFGWALTAALCLLCVGAVVFVWSGRYNIAADDHHSVMVLAALEKLRERSIAHRASGIEVPDLQDPLKVVDGADRYARLCVGCHLAPGVTTSEIRPGLYPHPQNLAQGKVLDAQRAFWIIKHGIKMSAMPAWGRTLSDAEIWDLVAFLRKLPDMSGPTYRHLLDSGAGVN
jgi:mono/diheme cytochrome c family protein